ncbi:MAG: SGNH/GDSL hydrolase family protein [Planctomycetota bacterium]|nr:SGNH/GDSL hydrolase family protein [Planctomycetota bacterium]
MQNQFLTVSLLSGVVLMLAVAPVCAQGSNPALVTFVANAPPADVGKVSQEDWNTYCKWEASLPADQQAWEKLLQKYLGGYYFPIYLKGRLAGKYTLEEPGDWGFVPDDPALPRVLLIGDSISHMYTESVRRLMKGKANVHRAPANCGPTDMGLKAMDDWLAETPGKRWDIIHFNFGIHDRKKTAEAYAANLEKLVARLNKTGAVLVWARTTPFANDPMAKVQYTMLNETADAVMTRYGIKIDDVYSTVAGDLDKYISGDKVHFNQYGVKVQAEQVAKALTEVLKAKK